MNDILHMVNVKVHNQYLENNQIVVCDNNSVAFRGKYPNRHLYRDKKQDIAKQILMLKSHAKMTLILVFYM